MSASVVRQFETESRIAARPRHCVGPLTHAFAGFLDACDHAAPECASSPNATTTWFSATSFKTS